MLRKKIILVYSLFILCTNVSQAQVDPHFTQFYAFPVWLNPAMSGVINGGDCRLVAIHRNQWNKVTNPFSTFGLSYDWLTKQTWGMGIQAVHQSAGNGGYQNTTLAFSICNNNLAFGAEQEHHFSLALQIGINNRSIQPGKFQYGDQYNPVIGYDPSIATRANNWINRQSIFQPDAGAGIFYYFSKGEETMVLPFGGISVSHINRPKDNFTDKESIIPFRYVAHAGAIIKTQSSLTVAPSLLYMKQGKSSELIAGIQGEYPANSEISVSLGANYRLGDAINALTSITYQNTRLGFSYDINTSALKSYGRPVNSMEFSISRIIMRRDPFQDMIERCPSVKL